MKILQTLKNSLSSLSLGGGKGGSDFNPKGKSENEVSLYIWSGTSYVYTPYLHVSFLIPDLFPLPVGRVYVEKQFVGL